MVFLAIRLLSLKLDILSISQYTLKMFLQKRIMGIKTANITDASNIPTNEVIGILEKIKFHTTLAYLSSTN